jgi:hypothetical protein
VLSHLLFLTPLLGSRSTSDVRVSPGLQLDARARARLRTFGEPRAVRRASHRSYANSHTVWISWVPREMQANAVYLAVHTDHAVTHAPGSRRHVMLPRHEAATARYPSACHIFRPRCGTRCPGVHSWHHSCGVRRSLASHNRDQCRCDQPRCGAVAGNPTEADVCQRGQGTHRTGADNEGLPPACLPRPDTATGEIVSSPLPPAAEAGNGCVLALGPSRWGCLNGPAARLHAACIRERIGTPGTVNEADGASGERNGGRTSRATSLKISNATPGNRVVRRHVTVCRPRGGQSADCCQTSPDPCRYTTL